ncbi:hypothetical protein OAU56_02280 [Nitrosopumilus sp.]|nr:hypothetical protein [bacterium]MDC1103502.1 hypothetical protein [Nitrosopumilus sp.]MDC3292036.1 hypothetical protein [Nitrosopumilus sp.]
MQITKCCNSNPKYLIEYLSGKSIASFLVCQSCSEEEKLQQFIIKKYEL